MALNGKVALVTGGIRGIGRAIVEDLMDEGANVLAAHYESQEEAAANICELQALAVQKHVKLITHQMDIRDLAQIKETFDLCEQALGKLDIFVGNAGVNIRMVPAWEYTEEEFDYLCDTNFKGSFFCARECGKRMNDGGRIVLISSSSVQYPVAGHSIYSPTKAAVEMLARDLSLELGEREITVNSVSPGLTPNTGMRKLDIVPDATLRAEAEASPRKRLGEPEDVARAVVLLCQPKAYWISGQHIVASGGALS